MTDAYRPMNHPVIVLIDNDDGATQIFKMLQSKKFGINIGHATDAPFYHLGGPLYLIKTPIRGADNKSCPEDFFHPAVLATKIDSKTFNPDKEHEAPGEYGKAIFAERVVRQRADTIDFSGFDPILTRIDAVLDDYPKRKRAAPAQSKSPAAATTKAAGRRPVKNIISA